MNIEQIEAKVIQLLRREPFIPFSFEMTDGRTIEIAERALAVNGGGAGFIGPDGGIVDIEFKNVANIRSTPLEAIP